jgi:sulfate transport system permease protein
LIWKEGAVVFFVGKRKVLPGFKRTMGFTILYLSLIVLIPLSGLVLYTMGMSWSDFWQTISSERVIASFKVSFFCAFVAAVINLFFGFIVAWVLERYSFPGKRFFDNIIDLPFALPTAVAGIALTALYSPNGWIGQFFEPFGIQITFTQLGITIALMFIGLPFVVRTVQPIIQELDKEVEEAAVILGSSRLRTFFQIILPQLVPALLTGFALAFARGVGEYGSVVFIAGNMPMETEIAPLLIMTKLEQFDYAGATAIALMMLILSFVILLLINYIQWKASKSG